MPNLLNKNASQETPDDYFQVEAISQSYLKQLIDGPPFKRKEPTAAMNMGTLVDDHICMSKDEFGAKYHITKAEKPSDQIVQIIDYLLDSETLSYEDAQDVKHAAGIFEYQKNWKNPDAFFRNIVENNRKYIEEKIVSKEKVVITADQYATSERLMRMVYEHTYTGKYFQGDYELQKEVFWTKKDRCHPALAEEYKCKAKWDLYSEEKDFHLITDFKYTEWSPKVALKRMRLDIQQSWYSSYFADIGDKKPVKFQFIFVSPYWTYPQVFMLDTKSSLIGKWGGDFNRQENTWQTGRGHLSNDLYGWVQALQLHEFYQSVPDIPYDVYTNNGHFVTEIWK